MQVEDLEFALREAAAAQPSVSPTARRDVVRRARRRWAAEGLALLVVVSGIGGLAVRAAQGDGKGALHVTTRPGPPSSLKAGLTPSTVPLPTGLTTVPPTTPTTLVGQAVPAGFETASITFVSPNEGWALGGIRCLLGPCPAVLLQTDDAGRTWRRVQAPPTSVTPLGNANAGVNSVRFADGRDGWAFGPELWVTHDGAGHWTRLPLGGAPVMALEVGAGVVHAALQDLVHPGIRIETSPVSTDDWHFSALTMPIGAGPIPTVQIVLQGRSGWIVENDRVVIAGARLTNGAWVTWQPPCSAAGGPMVLTAPDPTDLVAVCNEGIWSGLTHGVFAYFSSDGGTSFRTRAVVPTPGGNGPIASPTAGTVVVAWATPSYGLPELLATFDGGATWQSVYRGPATAELTYLGFTTRTQGVAIDSSGHLFMTFDGGHSWRVTAFR